MKYSVTIKLYPNNLECMFVFFPGWSITILTEKFLSQRQCQELNYVWKIGDSIQRLDLGMIFLSAHS